MAKTYIISNNATKSGKTTTAFNLALCFAAMGKKTLLVGTDKSWVDKLLNPKNSSSLLFISPFLSYWQTEEFSQGNLEEFEFILVDASIVSFDKLVMQVGDDFKLIIPVEAEYYGMNALKPFFEKISQSNIDLEGIIPVMLRKDSSPSENAVVNLIEFFGKSVFEPAIQRNYYLSRQKDFKTFSQSKMTEKAAVTYLNLANNLLDKNR
ncbi:ParA family protein [Arcticibacterium luteifluviistationis]|uniref:CobQ/CobB/MinD/ParA nucleotide binding domain-containing protein n=1 Tax=Arcticibacterium luteifluviistationis TaxID=1784714 RepID=A0A2Z4G833_9BACT|nr:ParA family protein [Arcticibacterium luteifluviistationis]AWV97317.1 hypothetical protein DJ013_03675 [Arcticibacterium luteifluviistationis]